MEQSSKVSREGLDNRYSELAGTLRSIGRDFYSRGWLFGTSGNLSAVVERDPVRLAITASGVDKGNLQPEHMLEIDDKMSVIRGEYRPSSESALHISVVKELGAGAVFHTHSVWTTALSEIYGDKGGIEISGFEMLKGLRDVGSHEHREWVPIFENSQDMKGLSREVEKFLKENRDVHGFILRGHGLYTWGKDPEEAKRHVEVIEFLMEVLGRTRLAVSS